MRDLDISFNPSSLIFAHPSRISLLRYFRLFKLLKRGYSFEQLIIYFVSKEKLDSSIIKSMDLIIISVMISLYLIVTLVCEGLKHLKLIIVGNWLWMIAVEMKDIRLLQRYVC